MGVLNDFAGWVRRRPILRKTAKLAVRMIPDREVTLNKPEVGRIRIRMRSHRWLLWERFLQDDGLMLGVFNRLVREGDVVYDIGANIGLYARVLPQWFGAKMVAAFEPMSQNFELLKQNVELGKLGARVRMFQMALSDVSGEEDLQIDDMNSGEAVLNSVSHGEASGGRKEWGLPPKTERVKVRTLDEVVQGEGLEGPAMMKIDTEGAEVHVLRGAKQTLEKFRPRLTVALHGDEPALGTIEFLNGLGYAVYGWVKLDGAEKYMKLAPGDAMNLANNNIVASMDERDVREEIEARVGGR